jgi:hypothetical protein
MAMVCRSIKRVSEVVDFSRNRNVSLVPFKTIAMDDRANV